MEVILQVLGVVTQGIQQLVGHRLPGHIVSLLDFQLSLPPFSLGSILDFSSLSAWLGSSTYLDSPAASQHISPFVALDRARAYDEEAVSLALEFQGLVITVRGSPASSLDFVQRLASSTGSTGIASGPPASSFASASVSNISSQASETRASIEASFPTCPAHLCCSASRDFFWLDK